MKRWLNILVLFCLSLTAFAQEDTRVVDSLLSVLGHQEGHDKVLTMIELTWEFYDVSYDDCIDLGEKAIQGAQNQGFADLEAKANYALGMQYGYHGDLDLANEYLNKAYSQYSVLGDAQNTLKVLLKRAFLEQTYGIIDSAFIKYEKVLILAEKLNDTLNIADVYFNKGVLQCQVLDYSAAETSFLLARNNYDALGDTIMLTHTDANLAVLYMEWGNTKKARKLFKIVIPKLENNYDYEWLLMVYKNYGQFYVKESDDYDSAYYYYEKAYNLQEMLIENDVSVPVNSRIDLLVEMGNSNYNKESYNDAIQDFDKALTLAESASYSIGQMMACFGLGTTYSKLSQPSKSIYYLKRYLELKAKSGITIAESSMRFSLILNYARLGRFNEMESELRVLQEDYKKALLETAELDEQNNYLNDQLSDLLQQHDAQNNQIQTLQTQRNHYRLAFFGILAIVLATIVLFVAYKIVRKNRGKV